MPCVQAITSIGQLDFVLELAGSAGDRQGILHFNTDLFDKATAHRMLGHYGVRILACPPKAAVHDGSTALPPPTGTRLAGCQYPPWGGAV